jgi:hypothetical protein
MLSISPNIHTRIYIFALSICAFALPLSVFLISLAQITLLLNWVIEKPISYRWQKIITSKPLWFLPLFYIVHLIWLFNTDDFVFAGKDLQIKLPFLILPIIVGTSDTINYKSLKTILNFFIAGVLLSSIYSSCKIFNISGDIMSQMLNISPFVWHIRLATMSVFAIFVSFWMFYNENSTTLRILYITLSAWFVAFIFIFQSLTGILTLIVIAVVLVIYGMVKIKNLLLKWFLISGGVAFLLVSSSWLIHFYTKNFSPLPVNIENLEKFTENGNPYFHSPIHTNIENGNFVDIYICNTELEKEWPKRSKIGLYDNDADGNIVKNTLLRYLTSKNLRKDSAGLAQLSDSDIENIEKGVANEIFTRKAGITSRLYRTMWELYNYSKGANPTGYSVAMRIEYLKTAWAISKTYFWFGTGTGDVLKELNIQYHTENTILPPKWRLRAHNQMLTFLFTFGIFGFIIVCSSIFIPPFLTKKYKDYLFGVFFIIFMLSMLSDDTLETHAGISFIALFYSILLFSNQRHLFSNEASARL